jgi:hypothetical protein
MRTSRIFATTGEKYGVSAIRGSGSRNPGIHGGCFQSSVRSEDSVFGGPTKQRSTLVDLEAVIEFSRQTLLLIVKEEPMAVIAWSCLAQLLKRPIGDGVPGYVREVEDASRADLHGDKREGYGTTVIKTKKSHPTIASACLRTKVDQR